MKKVTVDINVFISALLGSNNCGKIYDFLKQDRFKLIFSENIFKELIHVLNRESLGLNAEEIKHLLTLTTQKAIFIITSKKVNICRDKKDNKVLECAVGGNADFIVTGDKDLLTLKKFKGILIVNPSEFLKIFKQ